MYCIYRFQSLLSWKYNQISVGTKQNINGTMTSFNPCYLGNTIRSLRNNYQTWELFSFNPCYLGNTIRSPTSASRSSKSEQFQSLLSWKYNQIKTNCSYIFLESLLFQSLLSWKYNQIVWAPAQHRHCCLFQSLLSWKYNQIFGVHPFFSAFCFPGFNPCYLGNTIRSFSRMWSAGGEGSFNPCYLGNTIRSPPCPKAWSFLGNVVSILVILEIQSDLSIRLSFPTCAFCFNPCYLGNTIRSLHSIRSRTWKRDGFNPCYLGNTIRSI